ncbi:lysylphosphatidylglycerol synthase domain-containing protein [Acerihabitans sp. TG2]|uniref:lysylphosphatidylglycerol synthase domain-containing protein n=1 Tax=Acerihabitans sp. TG2 TaxID=3096008 RepID=UPI002B22B169|nr:lysylphosphatidylglycerol synthase domain-containing protein [Acerihabitans sp. TG2]MEA9389609.1 lysylphosphatidylglycerol synthase domain-containing protein [Acerihabitans sp. TG2]
MIPRHHSPANPATSNVARFWPRVKPALTVLFFLGVVILLVVYASKVDWGDVAQAVKHYQRNTILLVVALAVLSYLLYGIYDLIGRAYCRHQLAKKQVLLVSFICYAFTLTLSAWVGGIGMRYRLYSRLGLSNGAITRIFSLSLATNWLGYILLAGVVCAFGVLRLPVAWGIGQLVLRVIGVGLLLCIAAYLWLCAFAKRRHVVVKRQRLVLPSLPMAVAQLIASCTNWLAMAAIIFILLNYRVDFLLVLGVLLVSSIAGVIVHIPAGLGVLEGVFVAMLGNEQISHGTILAALLAYRAIYFIAPLLLAIVLYLWLESRSKTSSEKKQHSDKQRSAGNSTCQASGNDRQ